MTRWICRPPALASGRGSLQSLIVLQLSCVVFCLATSSTTVRAEQSGKQTVYVVSDRQCDYRFTILEVNGRPLLGYGH